MSFFPSKHFLAKGLLLVAVAVFTVGCAQDGSFKNPFSSDEAPVNQPANPYFFADFSDIPIPNDMSEVSDETVISYAPSGVKCGVQRFRGRVEVNSLLNAMRNNMAGQGWTLRSFLRAPSSLLIFEKPDRVATLYITDDLLHTNMRVFMSPRLEGDHSANGLSFTTPAANTSGTQQLSQ